MDKQKNKKQANAEEGDFIPQTDVKAEENKKPVTKAKKKKDGKPGFFKRIGIKIKDVFSELKKVTWPSFPKVVKQTGVVLAVVLIFLVVITAFDFGLFEILKLVVPNA